MKPKLMRVGTSGAAIVECLKASEMVMNMGSLKVAMALTTGHLDDLQLAVECMYLRHDVEYLGVRLVVVGELYNQPPVICPVCQRHGLVIRGCLP